MSVQVPSAMKLNVRGGQLAVGHEITIFPFGTEVHKNVSNWMNWTSLFVYMKKW